MIIVQDHTRVFTLALFGFFAFPVQHFASNHHAVYRRHRTEMAIILLLFLARLAAPHIDFSGARTTELKSLFH
jgi:hypothetical protein